MPPPARGAVGWWGRSDVPLRILDTVPRPVIFTGAATKAETIASLLRPRLQPPQVLPGRGDGPGAEVLRLHVLVPPCEGRVREPGWGAGRVRPCMASRRASGPHLRITAPPVGEGTEP